jgi:hypothetical protein
MLTPFADKFVWDHKCEFGNDRSTFIGYWEKMGVNSLTN